MNIFTNIAADVTLAVKAGPTTIFAVGLINSNAGVRYLQLFNSTTLPTTTVTPPTLCFQCAASSPITLGADFFGTLGLLFPVGLIFATSTTRNVYTAATNTEQMTTILYT